VLVSHRERRLELVHRGEDGQWRSTSAGAGQTSTIEALDCTLSVDEVFAAAEPAP
jgi:hypothetical protein